MNIQLFLLNELRYCIEKYMEMDCVLYFYGTRGLYEDSIVNNVINVYIFTGEVKYGTPSIFTN